MQRIALATLAFILFVLSFICAHYGSRWMVVTVVGAFLSTVFTMRLNYVEIERNRQ